MFSDINHSLRYIVEDNKAFGHDQLVRFRGRDQLFENALLLNQEDKKDRLYNAWAALDKVDIYAERFSAFDGAELKKSHPAQVKRFTNLTNIELGSLLSHLGALQIAANHPDENLFTMIFEDNIVTSVSGEGFKSVLSTLTSINIEETVHIIYFGKCMESCTEMIRVSDNIYRAVSPKCVHSYAIKNSFARRIIKDYELCAEHPNSVTRCSFFENPIDKIYSGYITSGIARGLVVHPGIFYQDVLNPSLDKDGAKLMNYQECKDLAPPLGNNGFSSGKSQKKSISNRPVYIIIIIVLVLISIIYILRRQGKMKKLTRWLIVGAIALTILGIFVWQRNKNNKNGQKRLTLKTVVEYSRRGRNHFPVNTRVIPSHKHDLFNPNGILYENSTGETIFLTSTRCFDGKSSYPLLQSFNPYLAGRENFHTLYSKMLWLESHKTMKSSNSLGYEDMRIFTYEDELYLIGVNLDRSATGLPGMILVKLDNAYNAIKTWHLYYPPVSNRPNKNWAPIVFRNGSLGFIVDLDPLLVVKRKMGSKGEYLEECELVYECPKQTNIPDMRNSTITISWSQIPLSFQHLFSKFVPLDGGYERFILMGHTKYVNINILKIEVLYQHYFVIVDLPSYSMHGEEMGPKIYFSDPFHVEEKYSPHIEYISGLAFIQTIKGDDDSWEAIVMYGLRDVETAYITLKPCELEKLLLF